MGSGSVEAEASAFTVSGGLGLCVTDSRAVGAPLTVTLAVAGADVYPPASVAVRVTV